MTSAHASSAVDRAHREAAPWVEKFARFGYAAKGVTYLLVGIFATQAAFTVGGSTEGSRDMLVSMAHGTWGTILVAAIGIGLIGYSLWMFVRAILDPENEGDDKSSLAKRFFYGISGVIHASLALAALRAAFLSDSGSSESEGTQSMVGMVLGWPAGSLLVGAVGIGIIGYGMYNLYKAYTADISDHLAKGQMSEQMRKAATISGRAGFAGRGIAFSLIGFFALTAAWQHDASEAGGLGQALSTLGSFGSIALGITAIGLAAYGIYMLIMARYRRIQPK